MEATRGATGFLGFLGRFLDIGLGSGALIPGVSGWILLATWIRMLVVRLV